MKLKCKMCHIKYKGISSAADIKCARVGCLLKNFNIEGQALDFSDFNHLVGDETYISSFKTPEPVSVVHVSSHHGEMTPEEWMRFNNQVGGID